MHGPGEIIAIIAALMECLFLLPEYEVLVVTGSESQAGTDANVLLTIYGKRGPSNRFHLKRKDGQRAFRRESEDVFHVVTGDIGLVSSIK